MIEWIRFAATVVLVLSGLAICCASVFGVYRFNYAVNRMHAAAMGDTLGAGLCLAGFAVSAPDLFTAVKLFLVLVFLWIAAPVSSHLLCKLEIETDEQRDEYMIVHKRTIEEEKEERL